MPLSSIQDPDHPAGTASKVKLSVRDISRLYGDTPALDRVSLDVYEGEFLTLLGPSGSGKTTLLQTICGLNMPTSGQLLIDGQDRTHMPPNKRDIGVVFQNYALFPHLTVRENIAFPLKVRNLPAAEMRQRVDRALEVVGLSHAAERFTSALSGGQQQRIALARCLVYNPAIILMDEPLSALDRKLREQMQMEIKRIHRETNTTIIFVTHDQEEALALSQRVCLMRNGRIAQIGTPQEMYTQPKSAFVADFIGVSNVFRGQVGAGVLHTDDGDLPLPPGADASGKGILVLRPEMLRIAADGSVRATVSDLIYAGSETRIVVQTASGKTVIVRHRDGDVPAMNAAVSLAWNPGEGRFLTKEF